MEHRTLLLTPWYFPHKILKWQDAVTMVYLEKADVVVEYSDTVSSPSVEIFVPAVVRIRKAISSMKRGLKFSRANVYARDSHTCQYCGTRCGVRELTYDHVIPRSRGGRTEWDNIVAACKACNSRKADRTPDECGMFPRTSPVKPAKLPLTSAITHVQDPPEEWVPFLGVLPV